MLIPCPLSIIGQVLEGKRARKLLRDIRNGLCQEGLGDLASA